MQNVGYLLECHQANNGVLFVGGHLVEHGQEPPELLLPPPLKVPTGVLVLGVDALRGVDEDPRNRDLLLAKEGWELEEVALDDLGRVVNTLGVPDRLIVIGNKGLARERDRDGVVGVQGGARSFGRRPCVGKVALIYAVVTPTQKRGEIYLQRRKTI
jgi:hypothetical protein